MAADSKGDHCSQNSGEDRGQKTNLYRVCQRVTDFRGTTWVLPIIESKTLPD